MVGIASGATKISPSEPYDPSSSPPSPSAPDAVVVEVADMHGGGGDLAREQKGDCGEGSENGLVEGDGLSHEGSRGGIEVRATVTFYRTRVLCACVCVCVV